MKKHIKFYLSLTCVLLLLPSCSSTSNLDHREYTEPSVSSPDLVTEAPIETPPIEETKPYTTFFGDSTLTGEQTYCHENITLTYNADLFMIAEQGEGKEFMVSVFGKSGKSIIPRIDILGMDTVGLSEAITKESFEELAFLLVSEYYGEDEGSNVSMVLGEDTTVLSASDPFNQFASTIVYVSATETTPSLYAEVSMWYNQNAAAIALLLLDKEATGDDSSAIMDVYESISFSGTTP